MYTYYEEKGESFCQDTLDEYLEVKPLYVLKEKFQEVWPRESQCTYWQ